MQWNRNIDNCFPEILNQISWSDYNKKIFSNLQNFYFHNYYFNIQKIADNSWFHKFQQYRGNFQVGLNCTSNEIIKVYIQTAQIIIQIIFLPIHPVLPRPQQFIKTIKFNPISLKDVFRINSKLSIYSCQYPSINRLTNESISTK